MRSLHHNITIHKALISNRIIHLLISSQLYLAKYKTKMHSIRPSVNPLILHFSHHLHQKGISTFSRICKSLFHLKSLTGRRKQIISWDSRVTTKNLEISQIKLKMMVIKMMMLGAMKKKRKK
jgi:hypothetical protein